MDHTNLKMLALLHVNKLQFVSTWTCFLERSKPKAKECSVFHSFSCSCTPLNPEESPLYPEEQWPLSVISTIYWKLKCMIYWLQLCSLCVWFNLRPNIVVFRRDASHAWKMRWRHWRSECRSRSAEDVSSVNTPECQRTSCTLHQCKRGMWVGLLA